MVFKIYTKIFLWSLKKLHIIGVLCGVYEFFSTCSIKTT